MDVVNKETTSPLSDDVAAVFKIIKEFRADQKTKYSGLFKIKTNI